MVREIQIRLALTELKLINVFKKREILNNQTEVIKMKKITSILLSIIMIYSVCFPITAFAAALPTVGISSLSVKKNTVTVKWKKKSKIMGYQIQYSTDSKFKKNKKSIKIKKAKITSKKISNLKKKDKDTLIKKLTKDMKQAAKMLEFEYAAFLRDEIEKIIKKDD